MGPAIFLSVYRIKADIRFWRVQYWCDSSNVAVLQPGTALDMMHRRGDNSQKQRKRTINAYLTTERKAK
jgi:hypothetical protein